MISVERLLRLDEAAALYFGARSGVTAESLARLARRGKLRVRKINNRLFVTTGDLAAMADEAIVERRSPSPKPKARTAPTAAALDGRKRRSRRCDGKGTLPTRREVHASSFKPEIERKEPQA